MKENMSPDEFRKAGYEVVDWIAHYLESIRDYPVTPAMAPGDLVAKLPPAAPDAGEPMDRILEDFRRLIVPALAHWNHPRFHAYFSVSASPPGILGEMLAGALNVNHMVWKSCPAATELEQVVLGWLREWLGLPPEYFGVIHDTASVNTMHAIAAAREAAAPEFRTEGASPGLTLYTSEHAHSSVEKGAIALGIGQKNVRKVPVDSAYRMRADVLADMIASDLRQGKRPFCVVPTTGTTSTTSIDPVAEVLAVARQHGMWVHVDGAYGGPIAMLPEKRHLYQGIEEVDSIVVNPHKWLFTPMDLSVLYTRRPDILKRAFSLVPEYLKTSEDHRAVNLMDYGVPLGRRFRSLKLWFIMRYYGREGVSRILRRHLEWAQEFARAVESDPAFELCAPVPLSTICFRLKAGDDASRGLLDRVNATGKVFLSHTVLNGRFVLRFAIGNIATTREDVLGAWDLIREMSAGD